MISSCRIWLLLIIILFITDIYGQDLILTKSGENLKVRIIEEGKKEITYFLYTDKSRIPVKQSKKDIKKYYFEKLSVDTNLIILKHDSLSNEDLLLEMIRFLISSGYEIESFSREDLTVNTKYNLNSRVTVFIFGHEAHLQSYYFEKDYKTQPSSKGEHMYGKKDEKVEKLAFARNEGFRSLDTACRYYLSNGDTDLIYKENIFYE